MARKRGNDDGKLTTVPWTADLALRVARVDPELPKPDQEAQIQAKIDGGGLPPEAVKALRAKGYSITSRG